MPVTYFQVVSTAQGGGGFQTKRMNEIRTGDVRIAELPPGRPPQYFGYSLVPDTTQDLSCQKMGETTFAKVLQALPGKGVTVFANLDSLPEDIRFDSSQGAIREGEVRITIPKPGATLLSITQQIEKDMEQEPHDGGSGGNRQIFTTASNGVSGRSGSVPNSDDGVTGYRAAPGMKFGF